MYPPDSKVSPPEAGQSWRNSGGCCCATSSVWMRRNGARLEYGEAKVVRWVRHSGERWLEEEQP